MVSRSPVFQQTTKQGLQGSPEFCFPDESEHGEQSKQRQADEYHGVQCELLVRDEADEHPGTCGNQKQESPATGCDRADHRTRRLEVVGEETRRHALLFLDTEDPARLARERAAHVAGAKLVTQYGAGQSAKCPGGPSGAPIVPAGRISAVSSLRQSVQYGLVWARSDHSCAALPAASCDGQVSLAATVESVPAVA